MKQEKEIKCIHIEKEEKNKILFTNDMIICRKISKELTKKKKTPLEKMIIARLQDARSIYKSQSLPYTLAMSKWNLKLKTQYQVC